MKTKKRTTLDVLKDIEQEVIMIRSLLSVPKKEDSPQAGLTNASSPQQYFTVVDDGSQKTSEIIKKMRESFDVYVYDEENVDKNFPPPVSSTTRKFKKNVEADEELNNKSANDLEKEGIQSITLRERLSMELQYFNETGKNLDIDNVTLCAGSRDSGGRVPYVDWYADGRKVYVYWCYRDGANPSLRSRRCVS
jgi:hypothetical protein